MGSITFLQLYASSGKPCKSSTHGRSPASKPASRICIVSPLTSRTRRERIPGGSTIVVRTAVSFMFVIHGVKFFARRTSSRALLGVTYSRRLILERDVILSNAKYRAFQGCVSGRTSELYKGVCF